MTIGKTEKQDLTTAALLGAIAGMRSLLAPAVVVKAHPRSDHVEPLQRVLSVAATLELLGDKTRFVPARTTLLPFSGRMACGALAGYFGARGERRGRLAAAALGGATAALSTQAMYRVRRLLSRELGLPNTAAGLLEDAAALWAAKFAATRLRESRAGF